MLWIPPLALVLAFFADDEEQPGPAPLRFLHGTSPSALSAIFREGFRAATSTASSITSVQDAIRIIKAAQLKVVKRHGYKSVAGYRTGWTRGSLKAIGAEDEWSDVLYATRGDLNRLGTPLPGRVYLGRSWEDIQVRSEGGRTDYALLVEIRDPSKLVPDEDWLGSVVGVYVLEGSPVHPRGLTPVVARMVELMGPRFTQDVRELGRFVEVGDDWRGDAPIGKEVILTMLRSPEGRALLAQAVPSASSVSYEGGPVIVQLLERAVRGPADDWVVVDDPWQRLESLQSDDPQQSAPHELTGPLAPDPDVDLFGRYA
jgi:hypothetical protein